MVGDQGSCRNTGLRAGHQNKLQLVTLQYAYRISLLIILQLLYAGRVVASIVSSITSQALILYLQVSSLFHKLSVSPRFVPQKPNCWGLTLHKNCNKHRFYTLVIQFLFVVIIFAIIILVIKFFSDVRLFRKVFLWESLIPEVKNASMSRAVFISNTDCTLTFNF